MATTKEMLINGIMTQVTEFGHTAQQIDDAVDKADRLEQYASNENLLHNWYFANPINQRGEASYSGNSSYTVDRWGMRGDKVTVDLESDGLAINCDGASFNAILQEIEGGVSLLAGKTVTLSALITENTNTTNAYLAMGNSSTSLSMGTVYGRIDFKGVGLFSTTINLPETFQYTRLVAAICAGNPSTAGAKFKIKSAKLELGPVQTLAHQDEDGNWVLNDPPPDPAVELAKCQRYQIGLTGWQRLRASRYHTDGIEFFIPLPVTLRAKPTLINASEALAVTSLAGSTLEGFTFSVTYVSNNGVLLLAGKTAHGLTDASLVINANTLILDANL